MRRKENRWKVFENRVMRRIFEPKTEEVTDGDNYILRVFIICIFHLI